MPDSPLSVLAAVLAVVIVLLAVGWRLYVMALRVDRLHRQVLGSRATLEAQLVHRAQAVADLVATDALDAASAALLSRAARDTLDCEGPLVEDDLDPETTAVSTGRGRATCESNLSRVVRTVLDVPTRRALAATPVADDALARLDKACYRLVLARRFHDTHVAEARRLRSNTVVKVFHLAGHAPLPRTFDIDDECTPTADTGAMAGDAPTNGGKA